MLFKRWALLLFFVMYCIATFSQSQKGKAVRLTISAADRVKLKKWKLPTTAKDSATLAATLYDLRELLQKEGYWLASIDSVADQENQYLIHIYIGEQVRALQLERDSLPVRWKDWLKGQTYRTVQQSKPIALDKWQKVQTEVLEAAADRGHPFAKVWLDSLSKVEGAFMGILKGELGGKVRWDSIQVQGSAKVKTPFLERHLQIVEGSAFSKQRFEKVISRLKKLPYIKIEQAPQLSFEPGKATLLLSLEQQPINEVDVLLGVQPNTGASGNTVLTGNVSLELHNPFRSGKYIRFQWQRLQVETQQLDVAYRHPYFLDSPYGIETEFALYRQDSSFLNIDWKVGGFRNVGTGGEIGAFVRSFSGREIEGEEAFNNLEDTEAVDISTWSGGIRFQWEGLDDPVFPKNGWELAISSELGQRSITDSLSAGLSSQWALQGEAGWLYQFPSKMGLSFSSAWGWKANERLFLNELYRIGGLKSLRGFNEQQFFVSRYGILKGELRLYAASQSYLFGFTDVGWLYEERAVENDQTVFGVGTGFALRTQGGIFQFVYAFGKSSDQAISFQQSKVHFGYRAVF